MLSKEKLTSPEQAEESTIGEERRILREELEFFRQLAADKGKRKITAGVLTTVDVSYITSIYPEIIEGILRIYDYLEKPIGGNLETENFLITILAEKVKRGELVTDEEVQKLVDEINQGQYSRQALSITRQTRDDRFHLLGGKLPDDEFLEMDVSGPGYRGRITTSSFTEVFGDNDAAFNKRLVLSRMLKLKNSLGLVGGQEVDYRKELVVELLLNAPFLESIIANGEVGSGARTRHKAYLEHLAGFARDFEPAERFWAFQFLTGQVEAKWSGEETPPPEVSAFDKEYIAELAEFAGDLINGQYDIDNMYALLRQTVLRRGRVFKTKTKEGKGYHEYVTSFIPEEHAVVDFEAIGGYDEHKRFYRLLIEKLEANDPIIEELGIIIAAGQQGTGKTLGVWAFASNLPPNAKAVFVDRNLFLTQDGIRPQHEYLLELAKLHPDIHIFEIMEDIDTYSTNREQRPGNPFIGQLLDSDSPSSEVSPRNLHILGTTNRLDSIDPAVKRPGRTSKILVYELPKDASWREAITSIHAKVYGIELDDDLLREVGRLTNGFTPAGIAQIFFLASYNNIKAPSQEDVKRFVDEIKGEAKLLKEFVPPGERG